MLSNVFLEKFFSNPEIRKVPVGLQSTVVKGLEEVLEDLQEENNFHHIAQILSDGGKKGGAE